MPMLNPLNLLLITAALCIVMVLVLGSVIRSRTPGVKEWTAANLMAFIALLLFALRGIAPDWLSIEVANALLAASMAVIYIGFRQFFSLDAPIQSLSIGLAMTVAGLAFFHYVIDSIAARIVVVSIFHAVVCFLIGLTITGTDKSLSRRYPCRFTLCVAFLFATGHVIRGAVYATGSDALTSAIQASGWNLVFLSVGTLVLPLFGMGAIMMVHDKLMTKAVDEVNRDFLTGVWSRRAFFETAQRELSHVQRTGREISLLVFDIDHFKKLNDTYGHAVGDEVLIALTQRILKEIRIADYLGRLGGEEFAVLLPESDTAGAISTAERLCVALHDPLYVSHLSNKNDYPLSVSISIGVATLQKDESLPDFLIRADKALYRAKAAGRNTVSLAG